jgi:hypothetical protein
LKEEIDAMSGSFGVEQLVRNQANCTVYRGALASNRRARSGSAMTS